MNTGHAHNTRFWYVFGFAHNYLMIIPITFIQESPGISTVQPKLDLHLLMIKVVAIPCNKENSWIRW